MNADTVQKLARERLGLRLGKEMSQYVLKRLQEKAPASGEPKIPIIGADARTGIPLRKVLPVGLLAGSLTADPGGGPIVSS